MMAINVQLTNSGITLDIAQKHVSNTRPCPVKDFLVGWTNNLESQRRTVYKKGCAFITSSPDMVKWNLLLPHLFISSGEWIYAPVHPFTTIYYRWLSFTHGREIEGPWSDKTPFHCPDWARTQRGDPRRISNPPPSLFVLVILVQV